MFPSKIEEDYISTDEYMSNKSTAAKRLSPPVISATDHSQRIGKLLPYISSMQQRRVSEKEYLLYNGNRGNTIRSSLVSSFS